MKFRKKKLINTGTQVRLTMWFVGVTAMSMLLLFMIFASTLGGLEEQGVDLHRPGGVMDALTRAFLLALGIALTVTFAAGVLVTHRVCGPIYRFTQFLEAVMRGEHPGECRIRKNDELHDFCAVLNRATEPLRCGTHVSAEEEATAPSAEESAPEASEVLAA